MGEPDGLNFKSPSAPLASPVDTAPCLRGMVDVLSRMSAPESSKPNLLAIAWPIFVEQGLRILIGIVDFYMVSQISEGAAAALDVSNRLLFACLIIFNFVAIGASVVITHHLGSGDRTGAGRITTNAIAVNTWLGAITSVAVFLGAAPLLRMMKMPDHLMAFGLPFLSLMGGTLFMEAMNMSIAGTLRAHKHTRDAMFVIGAQNILNVAGNCVLLYGLFGAPKMGVTGVALSSVFSRCCACVAFWVLLDYRTHLRLRVRDFFAISWPVIRRVLRIGLPAAAENGCYLSALMLVTTFTARLGEDSLAIQASAFNLPRFDILFSISIGLGTEIMVGHLVGAGRLEEAYHGLLRSLRTGLVVALVGILIIAAASPWLMTLFSKRPEIIASTVHLLYLSILIETGRVFNIVVINSLRATGDVGFPLKMAVLSMWGVWVPLAWALGLWLGFGLPGIWIAMATDEWLRGLLMHRRWKQRHWMKTSARARAHVTAATDDAALA